MPVGWLIAKRPDPYPYATDILLLLPFLIDTGGNALDLYDSVDWWDDLKHFVNGALLSSAAAQIVLRAGAVKR